ncbi:MAG TPA: 2-C-methyl-D-erythritol 4-phosphate cytidylyltransferase [Armatimonadetes bacterium]|nr:2-C-methyl-D-erythritol 4-phosphate cytidylyltransferase [Armatimonadota bacterium]
MRAWAIIPAAGRGRRLGRGGFKALVSIGGVPLVAFPARSVALSPSVEGLTIAGPPDEEALGEILRVCRRVAPNLKVEVVPGGETRQESVRRALESVPPEVPLVAIHDAARPFLCPSILERCLKGAEEERAVVAALNCPDTVRIAREGAGTEVFPRERVYLVQTPQAFDARLIREAHKVAKEEGFEGTDDAVLVERLGVRVAIVPGSSLLFKITTEEDLVLAEAVAERWPLTEGIRALLSGSG